MMEREAVSLFIPISLQVDMGRKEPHTLLAVYVSVEKQISDHDRYWGRNSQKKKPTRGEFSKYGN